MVHGEESLQAVINIGCDKVFHTCCRARAITRCVCVNRVVLINTTSTLVAHKWTNPTEDAICYEAKNICQPPLPLLIPLPVGSLLSPLITWYRVHWEHLYYEQGSVRKKKTTLENWEYVVVDLSINNPIFWMGLANDDIFAIMAWGKKLKCVLWFQKIQNQFIVDLVWQHHSQQQTKCLVSSINISQH